MSSYKWYVSDNAYVTKHKVGEPRVVHQREVNNSFMSEVVIRVMLGNTQGTFTLKPVLLEPEMGYNLMSSSLLRRDGFYRRITTPVLGGDTVYKWYTSDGTHAFTATQKSDEIWEVATY